MEKLSHKVKLYLKANGKTWEAEENRIVLVNNSDGNGDIIATWNVGGLAKPTDEQLNSYSAQAGTDYDNNIVRATRKNSYGDIGDQLDEIFKDIDAWKARIQAIKDSNPKG